MAYAIPRLKGVCAKVNGLYIEYNCSPEDSGAFSEVAAQIFNGGVKLDAIARGRYRWGYFDVLSLRYTKRVDEAAFGICRSRIYFVSTFTEKAERSRNDYRYAI